MDFISTLTSSDFTSGLGFLFNLFVTSSGFFTVY
ncbi:titin, partial [Nephila pilipes]